MKYKETIERLEKAYSSYFEQVTKDDDMIGEAYQEVYDTEEVPTLLVAICKNKAMIEDDIYPDELIRTFIEVLKFEDLSILPTWLCGFKDVEDFNDRLYSDGLVWRHYVCDEEGQGGLIYADGEALSDYRDRGLWLCQTLSDTGEENVHVDSYVLCLLSESYKDMYEDYLRYEIEYLTDGTPYQLEEGEIKEYVNYLLDTHFYNSDREAQEVDLDKRVIVTDKVTDTEYIMEMTEEGLKLDDKIIPKKWVQFMYSYNSKEIIKILMKKFMGITVDIYSVKL